MTQVVGPQCERGSDLSRAEHFFPSFCPDLPVPDSLPQAPRGWSETAAGQSSHTGGRRSGGQGRLL